VQLRKKPAGERRRSKPKGRASVTVEEDQVAEGSESGGVEGALNHDSQEVIEMDVRDDEVDVNNWGASDDEEGPGGDWSDGDVAVAEGLSKKHSIQHSCTNCGGIDHSNRTCPTADLSGAFKHLKVLPGQREGKLVGKRVLSCQACSVDFGRRAALSMSSCR
jgi:hypothetical protein